MRSTFKYGILTGIIVATFLIAFFAIVNGLNSTFDWGFKPGNIQGITGLLSIPILATGIFMTVSRVKKEQNNSLTYLQALKAGVLVSIITAIIVALFSYIYCTIINPGFAQYMVSEAQKQMAADHESRQQIATDSANLLKAYSPGAQVFHSLVGQSVVGTIISLIMGVFLAFRKAK